MTNPLLAVAVAWSCVSCGRAGFEVVEPPPRFDASSAGDGSRDGDSGGTLTDAGTSNDNCDTAIELVPGASDVGSTCGGDDTIAFTCGVPGTGDVFYKVLVSGGTQVDLTITTGFIIQLRQLSCTGVGGCMADGFSANGGGSPGGWWYFGVEHAAGDCGAFTITRAP